MFTISFNLDEILYNIVTRKPFSYVVTGIRSGSPSYFICFTRSLTFSGVRNLKLSFVEKLPADDFNGLTV